MTARTPPRSAAPSSSTRSATRTAGSIASALLLGWTTPAHAAGRSQAAADRVAAAKEEAAAVSKVAADKNNAGEFAMCAEMYQQAYRTDPSFLGYLFSAARCEQKAGNLDGAEKDFRLFLARSPKGDKLNDKAQQFLDEILEERRKPPAAPPEPHVLKPPVDAPIVPPVPLAVKAEPPAPSRTAAWTTLIGGGVLLVGGAALLVDGVALRADLRDQLAHGAGGLILDQTPAQAHTQETSYRNRLALGAGLATAGVAAVGAGLWLFTRSPESAAPTAASVTAGPVPLGIGFNLAWR